MNCLKCSAILARDQRFCGSCGEKVISADAESNGSDSPTPSFWFPKEESKDLPQVEPRKPLDPKFRERFRLAIISLSSLLAIVLVGLAVQNGIAQAEYDRFDHPNPSNPQKISSYFDKADIQSAISTKCDFSVQFPKKTEISQLKTHIRLLKNANNRGGRSSAKALQASWAHRVDANKYDLNIDAALLETSKPALTRLFKSNPNLMPEEAHKWLALWSSELAELVAKKCHVATYNSTWHSLATVFNSALSSAEVAAANIPWYPNGYEEWSGDSALAWKWVGGSCELGDYCWHVQVITQTGCASRLYGQLNLLDGSDTAIGYTNDISGSLGPNSKAILEFSSYQDGVSSGRLTELSCY